MLKLSLCVEMLGGNMEITAELSVVVWLQSRKDVTQVAQHTDW